MNREEFMRQLESLLQNISPAEREEALQYYNNYFDDAGPENEQEVIEALGDPARVAENIKGDMAAVGDGDSAYQRPIEQEREIIRYQEPIGQGNVLSQNKKEGMPAWAIVLLVILGVLASPALLGIAGTALGVLISILAVWFSLIIAAGAAMLALFAVMAALIVVGFVCLPTSPLTGLALFGAGLVCGGVGILAMMLTVLMTGIATPAICKGIVKLCKKLFGKKEVAA